MEHAAGNECYSAMTFGCYKRGKKNNKEPSTFMSVTVYLKIYAYYHSDAIFTHIYTYYDSIFYYKYIIFIFINK